MKVYLVGGAVRDALINYPVVEHDYVVVGSTPDEMLSLGYKQVGKDFPVFLHPKSKDEYALARKERKSGHGYTGFICDFDPTVTLEEDLYRRDLTINAIAQDENGKLVDPYNGQADLNNRLLRHVGPAFSEDPLRILRVARFAARYYHLGFIIAPETLLLMKDMVANGELKTLTKERIWLEIEKCLKTSTFHLFLEVINDINALADVLPILPSWSNLETQKIASANKFVATKEMAIDSDTLQVCHFCLCLEACSHEDLKHLEQTLKIPSTFANSLRDFKLLNNFLNEKDFSPENILKFFNLIDLWRRPERFNLLLEILKYAQCQQDIAQTLQNCAMASQAVTAQQVIALGYQGAAIKLGLQTARIAAIEKTLS
ncbi:tRNA nucleotidyltransferase [Pseudoalteromonas phenolica]|uniref:Multifunctional tRNA nucleotidyl transferase/2'3'-cyclic phosphodiesterase/2'nucleotidase/phosphatase n=1 Tax=Pseudoalteromonas phenolica TaxID=161398 RepID=A0A0S2JZP2_9GAMM|nr:tRNA nucleotidyltransferase [Pseudoalteromonas phenolica]ALO41253.1 Multifunctional tRNA nucleotidyl transferase/2'3'-cyclic phosphodiesterase/2'nucleotidase/phosphatase [Pseudoalteromonas phenolica]MBE0354209.1 tRNA nucleotidyltransferase (CCA-adding enzyme) [Pseudoalteromonas phenolica O-BC30]RXE96073.1 tRNA nucleotidyltransferase [Pseudoalteromonas phenolica O-BC30]